LRRAVEEPDLPAIHCIERGAAQAVPASDNESVDPVRRHGGPGLEHAHLRLPTRQGPQRFVLDTIVLRSCEVGDPRMRGELQIFDAHLRTGRLRAAPSPGVRGA
jgi:hypothetical protein